MKAILVGASLAAVVIAAQSGARPAFQDGFESGAKAADQNGYGWRGTSRRVVVSSANAHTGTRSLEFTFGPDAPPGTRTRGVSTQSEAEQRLRFGAVLGEFWVEYWLFVPPNYTHRSQSPYTSSNNKFLGIFWRANSANGSAALDSVSRAWLGYGSGHGAFVLNFETEIGGPAPPRRGDSRLKATFTARRNNRGAGNITEQRGNVTGIANPLVSDAGPVRRGAWTRIRIHARASSAAGALDGLVEVYAGSVCVYKKTDGDFYYPTMAATTQSGNVDATHPAVPNPFLSGPMGWNWMYLLGYSNSGFTEVTKFYVDDVRIYAANPSW